MSNDQTRTEAEADGIAAGLLAWDKLAQAWHEAVTDCDEAAEYVERKFQESDDATDAEAWSLAREFGECDDVWERCREEDRSPAALWLDDALEVVATATIRPGERPTLTGARVLLTLGGPNVWVQWKDGSDRLTIEVYWGGSEARRSAYVPQLVVALSEYVEQVEAMA